MYILKVGTQYVGVDGQLVESQKDAIRLDTAKARVVKLVPKVARSIRYTSDINDTSGD